MAAETLDLEDFASEDDLSGSGYPISGQYHVVVSGIDSSRDKINGIKVTYTVLAGSQPGQENKSFTETYWDPKSDSNDGGKFAKKKLAKLALTAGLISPEDLGKPGVAVDWDELEGRQIVAFIQDVENKNEKTGKVFKGAEVTNGGLDIFGLMDPKVRHVPKNFEALEMTELDANEIAELAGAAAEAPAPAEKKSAAKAPAKTAAKPATKSTAKDPFAAL